MDRLLAYRYYTAKGLTALDAWHHSAPPRRTRLQRLQRLLARIRTAITRLAASLRTP